MAPTVVRLPSNHKHIIISIPWLERRTLFTCLQWIKPGAYEWQSCEGVCNSSSIQIWITYVFPFLVRHNARHAVYHLLEAWENKWRQNCKYKKYSRFHKTTNKSTSWTLNIRQKHTERHGSRSYRRFKKSIEPSEIPAATVASALQTKPPQNSEGSWHNRILRVFEADCFRRHLFACSFLCG